MGNGGRGIFGAMSCADVSGVFSRGSTADVLGSPAGEIEMEQRGEERRCGGSACVCVKMHVRSADWG